MMFEEFGLRVYEPRASRSGTSNAGILYRRAFPDPFLLSKTLGIDEKIITRLHNTLNVINCKNPIN